MRCDIGTLKLEINFTLNVSCIFLNQQEISLYAIDEIKMNDIFSYKIKRQVFAQIFHFLTRSAFTTYIPI